MRLVILLVTLAWMVAGCSNAASPTTQTPGDVDHGFTTTTLQGQPLQGDGPENPMPLGESMTVGGWNLSVLDRALDADGQVVMNLHAEYVRNPGRSWFDELDIRLTDTDFRSEAAPSDAGCANLLVQTSPAAIGDVVKGSLCFDVADADAELILVVAVDPLTSRKAYFATE